MDLAQLFDRMDFTAIPPTSMHGGEGYAFNVKDCKNCMLEGDCYPKPMPSAKKLVSAPWYGDTHMVLDTPLKIKRLPMVLPHQHGFAFEKSGLCTVFYNKKYQPDLHGFEFENHEIIYIVFEY